MISPSAWTMKLITPCVEGCWGPMLRTISVDSSEPGVCPGRVISSWSSAMSLCLGCAGGGLHLAIQGQVQVEGVVADVGDSLVAAGLGVVLAQRRPYPVVREQDPPHVRMPEELHAEQVE